MNKPRARSPALLAVAGLASGVVTVLTVATTRTSILYEGLIFGAAIAVYFALYEGDRSLMKITLFMLACAASYPASQLAALGGLMVLQGLTTSQPEGVPLPALFFAGSAGAFLVLLSALILYGPRNIDGRSLARVLMWSVGGGILGVAGGVLNSILLHDHDNNLPAVLLIWQAGTALMLGYMPGSERELLGTQLASARGSDSPMPTASRGNLVVAGLFFSCLLGFLAFRVARTIQSERDIARREESHTRLDAEAPSVVGLAPVAHVPADEVLIDRAIDGLFSWAPMSGDSNPIGGMSLAREYSISYTAKKEPGTPPYGRIAEVHVTLLPNADWALYRTKYAQLNFAEDCPQCIRRVAKFGQRIIQISPRQGDNGGNYKLDFLWPSSAYYVSVSYETAQYNEAILQQYLEKYPSSL